MAYTLRQMEGESIQDYGGPIERAIWQRLEAYTAHRWGERSVEWIVEGPGGWEFPIYPVTIDKLEVWQGAWVEIPAVESPLGLDLDATGPYRVTGKAGVGNGAPAAVEEAHDRLLKYVQAAEGTGVPGASRYAADLGGVSESFSRDPAHLNQAIIHSGCADLLRPFRRL